MFLLLLLLVSSSSSSLLVLYLLVVVTCVAVSLFSAFRERASRRVSRREGVTSHVPAREIIQDSRLLGAKLVFIQTSTPTLLRRYLEEQELVSLIRVISKLSSPGRLVGCDFSPEP